jgi:UDP-N-acetylmuramoyl-tripeptide--D-alanyl-D-alanine ligase
LATPESYNTPLGIALTVRNLDSSHDIFIAEMGARSKGDIKELANLVKAKYGVLTGINNQHLETFGSIENIKQTKYELFENLSQDGVGFFSSDSENTVELYGKFGGEKYLAGVDGEENLVTATDIKMDAKGMSFTLVIKGEKPVKCNTVLLGTHSVKNICLAAAVAYKIGLSPKEIAQGINRIQSVGHRLELVPNNKNIVIIDDSYNSNVDGVNAAMEVLDTFKGRKIVLTPGLVELGKMENVANLELGKILAEHADIVIVIGVHNAEMIINGLKEGGMEVENIKFAKTLNKGNELLNGIMKEGDVVLFENDLPDNYN